MHSSFSESRYVLLRLSCATAISGESRVLRRRGAARRYDEKLGRFRQMTYEERGYAEY